MLTRLISILVSAMLLVIGHCADVRSAFFCFCNEERPKVKAKYPSYTVGEVAKELGKRWEQCTARAKYEQMAAKDRARYEKVCSTDEALLLAFFLFSVM